MNAFGGMFAAAAAAGYHQDPYSRMAALHDPHGHHGTMHAHAAHAAHAHAHAAHAHHMHHAAAAAHQYKVPRIYFKIPRVLPYKEQKEKFDSDDFFKKLIREGEIRYTGYRDRPLHERQAKFQHALRDGSIELSVLSTGFCFMVLWNVLENGYLEPHANTRIDFHRERGKVHLDAPVIVNGLCVRWKGYISLEKLDGVGSFRFDEDAARIEDIAMQGQVESYKLAFRDWEEQQQRYRSALQARQAASAATSSSSTGNGTATEEGNSSTAATTVATAPAAASSATAGAVSTQQQQQH